MGQSIQHHVADSLAFRIKGQLHAGWDEGRKERTDHTVANPGVYGHREREARKLPGLTTRVGGVPVDQEIDLTSVVTDGAGTTGS